MHSIFVECLECGTYINYILYIYIYTHATTTSKSRVNWTSRFVATKSRFPCTPSFQLAREIVEGNRLGKEVRQPDGGGRSARFTFLRIAGFVSTSQWLRFRNAFTREGGRGEAAPLNPAIARTFYADHAMHLPLRASPFSPLFFPPPSVFRLDFLWDERGEIIYEYWENQRRSRTHIVTEYQRRRQFIVRNAARRERRWERI